MQVKNKIYQIIISSLFVFGVSSSFASASFTMKSNVQGKSLTPKIATCYLVSTKDFGPHSDASCVITSTKLLTYHDEQTINVTFQDKPDGVDVSRFDNGKFICIKLTDSSYDGGWFGITDGAHVYFNSGSKLDRATGNQVPTIVGAATNNETFKQNSAFGFCPSD